MPGSPTVGRGHERCSTRGHGCWEMAPIYAIFAVLGELVYLQRTPAGGPLIAERSSIGAFLNRMRELREAKRIKSN